jgi:hypothetical protein
VRKEGAGLDGKVDGREKGVEDKLERQQEMIKGFEENGGGG